MPRLGRLSSRNPRRCRTKTNSHFGTGGDNHPRHIYKADINPLNMFTRCIVTFISNLKLYFIILNYYNVSEWSQECCQYVMHYLMCYINNYFLNSLLSLVLRYLVNVNFTLGVKTQPNMVNLKATVSEQLVVIKYINVPPLISF